MDSATVLISEGKSINDEISSKNNEKLTSPPEISRCLPQAKRSVASRRPYYCAICQKDLKIRENFQLHFAISHPTVKNEEDMFADPWRCLFCTQVFATPNRLSLHIKANHKETLSVKEKLLGGEPKKLHECKVCGAVMKTSQYLVKHTLKMHGADITKNFNEAVKDPRFCSICRKLCSGEHGLRCHLYWTHGKEVEKIDHTFKEFVDMELLASGANLSRTLQPSTVRKHVEKAKNDLAKQLKPIAIPLAPVVADMLPSKNLATDPFLHCNECHLTFENLNLIKKHRDLRHGNIQCPLCLAWCKGRISLEAHDDQVHGSALRFQWSQP